MHERTHYRLVWPPRILELLSDDRAYYLVGSHISAILPFRVIADT
jgi:hypothetical protein